MKTRRILIVMSSMLLGLAAGIPAQQKMDSNRPITLSDGSDPAPPVPVPPALFADGSDPAPPPHPKSTDPGAALPNASVPTHPDHPAHPSQPTPPIAATNVA